MFIFKKRLGDMTDREFEEFREFEGRELEELDCSINESPDHLA